MIELLTEASIITAMLIVNAVFAAYEIDLASIPHGDLTRLAERNAPGAVPAVFMKERIEGSLALIQLGITLAGAIAAATGGAGVAEYIVPHIESLLGLGNAWAEVISIALFVIPLSAVTILFSELVPKMIAIENNERIVLACSPVMQNLYRISYPVIMLFENAVRLLIRVYRGVFPPPPANGRTANELEELWSAITHARSRNAINAFEEKLANSAISFSRKTLTDAMVPASSVSYVAADATLSEALIKAHMDMHTRFPVLEKDGDMRTVIGYLNFKDIVTALRINPADPTVRGITRPIKRLEAETPASDALQEMMADNAHMVVVSSAGAILGIITMEDIVEMLVGKILDEYDKLPVYIHNSGSSMIVGGGARLPDICRELGVECGSSDTLSQWAREKLGREIRGGDIIKASGLEVWVRKTRRRYLMEAIVMKARN